MAQPLDPGEPTFGARMLRPAALGLIALGALARAVRYLDGRSLWGDEGALAANVAARGLAELGQPLDLGQAAPVGFLWLEKLVTLVLGGGEHALRLVPFAAGMAALWVFHDLVRRWLGPRVALGATALLAVSEPLVYYSSELKPYSSDVLAALWIVHSAARVAQQGASRGRLAALAASGALGVWLSLPAAFVCGGAGGVLIVSAWLRGGPRAAAAPVAVAGLWLASFGLHYRLFLAHLRTDAMLQDSWQRYFAPPLSEPVESLLWHARTFFDFWHDPAGFPATEIAALLFLLGVVLALRHARVGAALLLAPLALAVLAATMGVAPFPTSSAYAPSERYTPYFGRLVLFAVPLALPFVAAGLATLLRSRPRGAAGWIAAALLLPGPVAWTAVNLFDPPQLHDARGLMERVAERFEPEDRLFGHRRGIGPVVHYARRLGLGATVGTLELDAADQLPELLAQIRPLSPGRRFWVVTLHHRHWFNERHRDEVDSVLELLAERRDRVTSEGAEATLWRRGGSGAELP